MIHKLRLHPFYQNNGGKSGIKRGGSETGGQAVASPDMVRGVPQSEIDKLRGTRDHLEKNEITWETIKEDYARVGITITNQEAREIREAVSTFTGDSYTEMRAAWRENAEGKGHELTRYQQELLKQYQLCDEYCKVAPTYKGADMIHRGIRKGYDKEEIEYVQKLFALKPGDKWNNDGMPSSCSTDIVTAKTFAGFNGIIIHVPTKSLKNSPSVKGISQCYFEDEVFLGDYNLNVKSIADQRQKGDGRYHIYLE